MTHDLLVASGIAQLSNYGFQSLQTDVKKAVSEMILEHLPQKVVLQLASTICDSLARGKHPHFEYNIDESTITLTKSEVSPSSGTGSADNHCVKDVVNDLKFREMLAKAVDDSNNQNNANLEKLSEDNHQSQQQTKSDTPLTPLSTNNLSPLSNKLVKLPTPPSKRLPSSNCSDKNLKMEDEDISSNLHPTPKLDVQNAIENFLNGGNEKKEATEMKEENSLENQIKNIVANTQNQQNEPKLPTSLLDVLNQVNQPQQNSNNPPAPTLNLPTINPAASNDNGLQNLFNLLQSKFNPAPLPTHTFTTSTPNPPKPTKKFKYSKINQHPNIVGYNNQNNSNSNNMNHSSQNANQIDLSKLLGKKTTLTPNQGQPTNSSNPLLDLLKNSNKSTSSGCLTPNEALLKIIKKEGKSEDPSLKFSEDEDHSQNQQNNLDLASIFKLNNGPSSTDSGLNNGVNYMNNGNFNILNWGLEGSVEDSFGTFSSRSPN